MSEFSKVMHEWHRMCDCFFNGTFWTCDENCSLYDYTVCSKPQEKYPVPLEMTQELADEIAQTIMIWAKENPEPVYPTFAEWLNSIGVAISDRPFPSPNIPVPVLQVNEKMFEPIPEKLAKKLELKPKVL